MNEENIIITPPKEGSNAKGILKEIIIFALIAFGIVLPFRMFIAEPYVVSGSSMDPTFTTGEYLIVDKLSYEFHDPKRLSVVIFKFPTVVPGESSRVLIKRIIGLPGDTVKMEGNTVTITNKENPGGFVIDQSYITYESSASFTTTLEAGQYWVMGDNRPVSYDSRAWGVLPRSDIIGKPLLRLLPVTHLGLSPGDHS